MNTWFCDWCNRHFREDVTEHVMDLGNSAATRCLGGEVRKAEKKAFLAGRKSLEKSLAYGSYQTPEQDENAWLKYKG
jgi:hypothetical protein